MHGQWRKDPRSVKVVAVYAGLVLGNVLAWAMAVLAFHAHSALLGTALLAYMLGIRHAVDADHLAAIDNATRKLMHDGQHPVTVGLHFSLGHSTVVFLACSGIAVAASAFERELPQVTRIGGVIGTVVSMLFLLLVAGVNTRIVVEKSRSWRRVRPSPAVPTDMPKPGGVLARVYRPLFGLVGRSWHMYPLGFLLGLGFDTATEVALLGVAAMQAAHGLPWHSILIFPALFTAGMALVDTSDGILMSKAYSWAMTQPTRKHCYDMTITIASICTALLVGGIEMLGMIAPRSATSGAFWMAVDRFNSHPDVVGGLMIGFLLAIWATFAATRRSAWQPRLLAASRRAMKRPGN